jgi:tRNA1Val (adenine37-N6)-methyltransferase
LGHFNALLQYLDCTRYVALADEGSGLAKDAGVAFSFGGVHGVISGETTDPILNGSLRLIQPRRGYRFSLDAILLGRFIHPKPGALILELGAGCGVISIMAAALYAPREVVALEIQTGLADLIERNAALNRLTAVRCVIADLRAGAIAGLDPASFDVVIANPPYRTKESGRRSPVAGRDLARAESGGSLHDFVAAASRYLKHGGKAAFVFTAARAAELISELRLNRLEPKRLRMVHPRLRTPATTILVEARKGGGVELEVEPPLIVYASKGIYSEEAATMLGASADRT